MTVTADLTVVLPADDKADNLTATVEDFLTTLDGLAIDYRIIVVNDGSVDATRKLIDSLSARRPDRFTAVHHEASQGYGAAVRTGVRIALESGCEWVLITDSAGQFKASQAQEFLDAAHTKRSSLVVGYRENQTGPLLGRVRSRLWNGLNRVINGVRVRDVGCAYKLFHRSALAPLVLRGNGADIGPELVAKAQLLGINTVQLAAEAQTRERRSAMANRPLDIGGSLADILRLFSDLFASRNRLSLLYPLINSRDKALRYVTLVSLVVSVIATGVIYKRGYTLAYLDSIAHQMIARRIIESPTPGLGQLGGVWLPLTHVLSLPLIASSTLFYNGLAGTAVSMAAYVIGCRYLFQIGRALRGDWKHGLVAAAVFGLNANVLYMQSTPMTEVPLLAGMAGSLYYLQSWCITGHWKYLTFSSLFIMLACLVRYEAWVLLLGEVAVIAYVVLRRRTKWDEPGRGMSSLVFFGCIAGLSIPAWIVWNTLIFHDPLYFQSGIYAKPSIWVSKSEPTIGNWKVSFLTYAYAVLDNLGIIMLVLAGIGALYYVASTRLSPEHSAPLALLTLAPFFVWTVYAGQRPMHVNGMGQDLLNVRFGLMQVLLASIFIAYLSSATRRPKGFGSNAMCLSLVTASFVVGVIMANSVTLREGIQNTVREQNSREVGFWLAQHYDGGKVLMENFGNETTTFYSHIPTGRIVYEGTNARGEEFAAALANPERYGIRWIYARQTPEHPDTVYKKLNGSPLLTGYELVYQDAERQIFRSRSTSTLVPNEAQERIEAHAGA